MADDRILHNARYGRPMADRLDGDAWDAHLPKLPLLDRWAKMDANELRSELREQRRQISRMLVAHNAERKRLEARIAQQRAELNRLSKIIERGVMKEPPVTSPYEEG